ncbi:hypothetical protein AVEN_6225-1, partial [Araneus ventricosus]
MKIADLYHILEAIGQMEEFQNAYLVQIEGKTLWLVFLCKPIRHRPDTKIANLYHILEAIGQMEEFQNA